jgi:hypothetical protein
MSSERWQLRQVNRSLNAHVAKSIIGAAKLQSPDGRVQRLLQWTQTPHFSESEVDRVNWHTMWSNFNKDAPEQMNRSMSHPIEDPHQQSGLQVLSTLATLRPGNRVSMAPNRGLAGKSVPVAQRFGLRRRPVNQRQDIFLRMISTGCISEYQPSRLSRDVLLSTIHRTMPATTLPSPLSLSHPFEAPASTAVHDLNESVHQHIQRQRLYAGLVSAATLGPLGPAVLGSLLTGYPQVLPPSGHLPQMDHYLMMYALHQLQQNQVTQPRSNLEIGTVSVAQAAPIRKTGAEAPKRAVVADANDRTLASDSSDAPVIAQDEVPLCLPVVLFRTEDDLKLSGLQSLLRMQIEAFQASEQDVTIHVRGRNKSIQVGQVGIRCLHCAHMPALQRSKGSTYFPTSVWGFYQASQNMCNVHLSKGACRHVPSLTKMQFAQHVDEKRALPCSRAGRRYWAETAQKLGLVDTEEGVFFVRELPPGVRFPESNEADGRPGVYRKSIRKPHP